MIYLDNAATTKIDQRVLDEMMPFLTDLYGNAGALYGHGRTAADAIQTAREQVADLICADPDQIIFTSGGTEANNLVFEGAKDFLNGQGLYGVVTTAIEHDSILNELGNRFPKENVTYVKPRKNSTVYSEDVLSCIDLSNVGIVSVMHTNNETGLRTRGIEKIGEVCKENCIMFHVDAVQAVGSYRLNVDDIGCDFLSMSSHKIHGPKGIGALYVRDKSVLSPLIYGGSSQEFGLRGGTENVAAIVGFGKACEILNSTLEDDAEYIAKLRQIFYNKIVQDLSKDGLESIVHINGDVDLSKSGKVLNLRFDNVDGETLLLLLDSYEVCASAGSACTSRESKPSHVLTAMGIDEEDARNSVRFSFSRMNSEQEVKDAADIVSECVSMLRLINE